MLSSSEPLPVRTRAAGIFLFLPLLAELGFDAFWLLPLSPFVAVAALTTTRHSAGWPRTLAKTGAVLTVLWGVMFAALFLWFVLLRILNGAWAF